MAKDPEEWFRRADYDLESAEDLFNGVDISMRSL